MAERIALKRLSGSDLSFFDFHFRNKTYGDHRQKGINLNEDVFVDQFYPQAKSQLHGKWEVLLTILGPGSAPAYSPPGNHRRPITYNNGKNWRLNGGTVPDDPADSNRFKPLAPGDLAVLRFRGALAPTEADVVLIAQGTDRDTHARLDALIPSAGRKTMIPVTAGQLEAAVAGLSLPEDHPLLDFQQDPAIDAAVEDVALGGVPAKELSRKRGGRRLTPEQLLQAREKAQRVGSDGEELLNHWLMASQDRQEISELDWVSQRDAAAPYDFTFNAAGARVKLDAKSTLGPFDNKIHMSLGEALEAVQNDARYDLARLYSMEDGTARLRIARDIAPFAKAILDGVSLPRGIRVDGFSIDPNLLSWTEETVLDRPTTEE